MFEQKLNSFQELPVRKQDRKLTDCLCTIIGALFALTLFILAFVMMNTSHYYQSNFPTDSDGKPCAYGDNSKYPFIFFPDIHKIQNRVCVSVCPQSSGVQLICKTNSAIKSCSGQNTYASSLQFQRLGGFCAPNSEASLNLLVENLNLKQKWNFLNTYDIIKLSLAISLGLGVFWMAFVHCIPIFAANISIVIGSLTLIAGAVILFIDNGNGWQSYGPLRIIIVIFLILFGVIFFVMIFLYKRRIKITGVFLSHAGKFLSQKLINLIFIPIFIIFLVGLIVLCLFEYLAFTSNAKPFQKDGEIYLQLAQNNFITILVVIEFIWGIQFLKDSFNFIISGNTAEWYVKCGKVTNCYTPVDRLLRKNFGSVVGGSFLNAFFNFIDFIFEIFRCYPEGYCGVCAPMCTTFSKCCGCFFDMVRTDAYSYINLTGIPYCNAARNCQVLCSASKLFIGSQSVMFFYRLCAHIFCVGLTTLICYWMMKSKIDGINFKSLIIIMILSYCVATYFIDIHADAAEALQIAYLTQLQLSGDNPNDQINDFQGLKGQIRELGNSIQDRQC